MRSAGRHFLQGQIINLHHALAPACGGIEVPVMLWHPQQQLHQAINNTQAGQLRQRWTCLAVTSQAEK